MKIRQADKQENLHSVEMLRGIAALLVCYFHLSCGNNTFLSQDNPLKIAGSIGWVGVEIFFVISGFIIPYALYFKRFQLNNFGTFLKKRAVRIEPPYLVSILLVIGLNLLSNQMPGFRGELFVVDWSNIASHFGYFNVITNKAWLNPVYWSLAIELQFYLIIALFFPALLKKSFLRVFILNLFIAASFLPLAPGKVIFYYSSYFVIGIVFFLYFCKIIKRNEASFYLLLASAPLFFREGLLMVLLALSTGLFIVSVKKVPVFFRRLGLISYSLYLIHVPLGGRIINLAERFTANDLIRSIIVLVSVVLCVIAANIFYTLVEKRFQKASSKITYPSLPNSTVSKMDTTRNTFNSTVTIKEEKIAMN